MMEHVVAILALAVGCSLWAMLGVLRQEDEEEGCVSCGIRETCGDRPVEHP